MSDWMCGDVHQYVDIDSDGNYRYHEPDLGPECWSECHLGPRLPFLQGPRSREDALSSYCASGCNSEMLRYPVTDYREWDAVIKQSIPDVPEWELFCDLNHI